MTPSDPPSPPPGPPSSGDWRETLRKAVDLAAEDPEAFREAVEKAALKLGLTADQVFRQLKEDPDFLKRNARRALGNATIQGLAKRLKKEFGL